jgi:hypothetical protein
MQTKLWMVEEANTQMDQMAIVPETPNRHMKSRAKCKYSWRKEGRTQRLQKEHDTEYISDELIY